MPCRSRRVRLPSGLTVHLLEWGGDEVALDHTVLLLHGFLENAWAWEETVEAGLAGGFHVLALDFRGHGDSDRVGAGGEYHFPDYVADLHELVPRVARARVSLVGHSMGGVIAAYYSGACPERVTRLVLMEGTGGPGRSSGGPARLSRWLTERQRVRDRPQRSYATLDEAADRLRENDPMLRHELALRLAEKGTSPGPDGRWRFKHDPRLASRLPDGFDVDHAMRFWAEVRCPVLLVDGEHSEFRLPADEARRRWSTFRDVRSAVLAGAGHMMQRHQPRALARLVADFLREDPPKMPVASPTP